MEWLIENPIANMYGPAFLLFYTVVSAATLGAVAASIALSQSRAKEIPLTPLSPDPYEIACLRGGANEVFRLALFSLFQRGYLQISGTGATQEIGASAACPGLSSLSALEQTVFAEFAAPQKAAHLFQSPAAGRIAALCQGYERRLRQDGLLETEQTLAARRQAGWSGFLVIVGLGGYKLFAALAQGHSNVGFLIIMGILALVFLALISMPRRLSRIGRIYLQRLQTAFSRLQAQAPYLQAAPGAEDAYLLTMGVFGVAALAGTPFAPFEQMFHRAAASGSGGCGAGCGSSGGCGGGGCGGGGCGGGGCGGGCGGCGGG